MIRNLALLLWILAPPVAAQDSLSTDEFRGRVAAVPLHGKIGWYLDNVNADAPGPLIVWLPGSGAMPYFQNYADGSIGYAFPPELLAYRNEAHFLLIEKPGVPFSAQLDFDEESQRPIELDSDAYREGLTKDNLVARAAIAIRAARAELGERATQVIIIGGSEGGQYAFALAREVQADRVIAWGGIALPQYFDLVLEFRLQAERGEITRSDAQNQIDELYSAIRAIEENPQDITQRFHGEAYRRWSSFGPYYAIDDMLSLEVPLLLIQGGADSNAPILNSDYAMIAFLSEGRTNLDYWVYPNLDHFFRDVTVDPTLPEADRSEEVWDRVWR
jgi:pimeloyl-ACP methyl ester carboxylesterase